MQGKQIRPLLLAASVLLSANAYSADSGAASTPSTQASPAAGNSGSTSNRAPMAPQAPRAPNAPAYNSQSGNYGTEESDSVKAQPSMEQERRQSGEEMEKERERTSQ